MLEWLAIGLIGAGLFWEAKFRSRGLDAIQSHSKWLTQVIDKAVEALWANNKFNKSIAAQVRANIGILRSHQAAIESANEIFRNQVTINNNVLDQLAGIRGVLEGAAAGPIIPGGLAGGCERLEPGLVRAVEPDQTIADLSARVKELEALVDTMVTGSLPDV